MTFVGIAVAFAVAACSSGSNGSLPAGSYTETCLACTATASLLTCLCDTGGGAATRSSLSLPCDQDIANCGGILTCGGCGGPDPPGGGCTYDSDCSSACSSDCYQCLSGSCTCGYEGVSGCVF